MKRLVKTLVSAVIMVTVILCIATAVNASGAEPVALASGFCGKQEGSIEWTYFDNGELVLNGSGEMCDYTWETPAPWNDFADNITTATVENGITTIGDCAFAWTWLMRAVSIPSTVTRIGDNAFYNGGLAAVALPDGLVSIGAGAFNSCEFTEIVIPSTVEIIGDGAFYYCNLEQVVIPESVTEIGAEAFAACFDLQVVALSSNIENLGESVFSSCYSLESISIPEGIETVSNLCFFNCTSLEKVTLPTSVTTIGKGAFKQCAALKRVEYGGSAEEWNNVFVGEGNESLNATISFGISAENTNEPISQDIIFIRDIFVNNIIAILAIMFGI